jgi:hypothetical protein
MRQANEDRQQSFQRWLLEAASSELPEEFDGWDEEYKQVEPEVQKIKVQVTSPEDAMPGWTMLWNAHLSPARGDTR